jgi:hypothetical protein
MANSQAGRLRQQEFEQRIQQQQYQSQLRLHEFQQEQQIKQQAAAGELGQMVGTVDAGDGQVAAVFVNPVNSERTVVKLGMPVNEFMQKVQAIKALKGTVSLDDADLKKIIFGIGPTGPEAQAAQDAKDWIDSKNPDPNISGPAQLRLAATRAGINATNALTAERQAGLANPRNDKQLAREATVGAITVFGGKYKQDFILRKQQQHLQELMSLSSEAQPQLDPRYAEFSSIFGTGRGNPQVLANMAAKMAQKDAQEYFNHLMALKKGQADLGMEVIHIEEIRKKAEEAQAVGKDPNVIWDIFKNHHGQDVLIVDDDLQPWSGQAIPGQGFQEATVGAKGKEVKTPPKKPTIPLYRK